MGNEGTMTPFQMSLEGGKVELENICGFSKGTVIYPEGWGARTLWILSSNLIARKLIYEVRGLTGYEAVTLIKSHHNGKDWSLPKGTCFGAYANKARKIRFAK